MPRTVLAGHHQLRYARHKPYAGPMMSSDLPLAFDSLDARARAHAGDNPLDRISLRDHVVEVEIGAFQVERGTKQRVAFDIVVEVVPADAPLDDDVDRILSYDMITQAIATELAAERLNLLETLAERIAKRILEQPQAARVYVRIQKLDRGPGALGVEIVRGGDTAGESIDDVVPSLTKPILVFFSEEAIASDRLGIWIDELEAYEKPSIICVAPPSSLPIGSSAVLAQRRIDLLAIEQNAWVLAGRDSRCVVVDTRTELDWGLGKGQISVWAPSRMVLDSLDRPSATADALLCWFADQMNAAALITIGAPVPDCWNLPAVERSLDAPHLF